MILGIGCDIIEVSRIEKSIQRHGSLFLDRIYTETEQAYCLRHSDSARRFAVRFSAKEAISKAFGTGMGASVSWLDMEILNDEQGKPIVHLSSKVKEKFNDPQIQLSLSHCKEYALAMAVWT